MKSISLEKCWNDIPIGKVNAITYPELMIKWDTYERRVREILHELSLYDNGDDYILVRSAGGKGFYRTDNIEMIQAYKKECLNKGKSVFAPVKKINRVLRNDTQQYAFENNLRVLRETNGLKQSEVCKKMKTYDKQFDKSLLSKMENGVCVPTPHQLVLLSQIYGTEPQQLLNTELYL